MIKTVHLKTAVATAIYYLAILALVAFLGVVVIKLVIWPPCSITTRNECVVDGWSIAGLAGAVLGVGATVLAILGAVAVAYWWTNLNEKVDRRVDEQIKTAIDQSLKEQEEKISERTTLLLKKQEEKFEESLLKLRNDTITLGELAANIERRLQATRKDLIIAMTQLDPWMIESWATDEMAVNPSSEVGVRMVRKYLQYVDGFFPSDPNDLHAVLDYTKSLQNKSAPYDTPLGYWQKALDWQKKIHPDVTPEFVKTAELWIEHRRPKIESWKKGHVIV